MPECNLPIAIDPNALRLLVLAHPSSKLITLIKEYLNLKKYQLHCCVNTCMCCVTSNAISIVLEIFE